MPNLPDPMTREQYYLKAIAENIGNGGGGDVVIAEEQTCTGVAHDSTTVFSIVPSNNYGDPESYAGKIITISYEALENSPSTESGECIVGELGAAVYFPDDTYMSLESEMIYWYIYSLDFVGMEVPVSVTVSEPGIFPLTPADDGTYVLKMTVENGVGTMRWGNEFEA